MPFSSVSIVDIERLNVCLGVFTLPEKSQNTEFFLVRIFPYSVQMRENTDQKKLRIWPLFAQCQLKYLRNKHFTEIIIFPATGSRYWGN